MSTLETWVFTVVSLTWSFLAISALDSPLARSLRRSSTRKGRLSFHLGARLAGIAGQHQGRLVGEHHRLHPVAHPELGQHMRHMRLDGGFADEQLGSDFGVGPAARNPPEH